MAEGNWLSRTKYLGLFTLLKANEIGDHAADILNADVSSSTAISPLEGYSLFGNQTNTNDDIRRTFTYINGEGRQTLVHVRDNGTNTIVEYLNTEDTRNSSLGQWSILEAGLSRVITLQNGDTPRVKFDFASANDTGTDQLVYSNQVEAPRVWNGAQTSTASTAATTITKAGTRTWAQAGFGATGSVIINGTVYAYTGGSTTTTLTGVTPNVSAEADGSGVAQIVNTSTLSAADKGGILLSANGRLFLAGITATPNQVTFSDVGDITNFAGTNPDDGGFEDWPQLNGPITALSFIDEWNFVFSEKKIIAWKFEFPTSTTKVTIRKEIADEGCANWKAIEKVGNQIFYTTPRGGLKRITQVEATNVFNVEDLTLKIRPTVEDFIWDDASLTFYPRDRIFVMAGQSNDTIANNDKAITLQLSEDGEGVQVFNIGIIDWFIGDSTVYNDRLHFGSSLESRSFLAFDGFSKDGAPMNFKYTTRIEDFGNQWTKQEVGHLAIRGSIATGTTLKIKISYDELGSTTVSEMQLVGTDSPYVIQQPLNMLGTFGLGTQPLGGTNRNLPDLNPFKVIFPLTNTALPYNIQITFETEGSGQNFEITSHGINVIDADEFIDSNILKSLGN